MIVYILAVALANFRVEQPRCSESWRRIPNADNVMFGQFLLLGVHFLLLSRQNLGFQSWQLQEQ